MDFKKIEEQNKEVIETVGECPLSCMNVIEALEAADCFSIGLQVSRPEAAIADPTRLIIKDIVPTFYSGDSFLQSAEF